MVILGSALLLVLVIMAFASQFRLRWLEQRWLLLLGMLSIPLVWCCSQAGWVVSEVGRQPWTIQDLLPVGAAISDIPASGVQTTFWLFAAVFTLLLAAEVSIMIRFLRRSANTNIETTSL